MIHCLIVICRNGSLSSILTPKEKHASSLIVLTWGKNPLNETRMTATAATLKTWISLAL
jgi:hypothetical protein